MRSFLGVVALEQEAEAAVVPAEGGAVADPIGDNANSLETDLIAVGDDAAQGQAEQAAVDEATEVVEALEEIAETLEVAAANGGLDKNAADVVAIATEHMYERVGLRGKKSVPSLEHFGGTSSRVGATKMAMEDIKQKAADIWKSIVAAFKRAIQWAVDFYNKIFGAWEKLEKRADALEKKADGVEGTAKEKTFESDRLVKALAVGGTVGNVTQELGKLNEITKAVFGGNTSAAEALTKAAEDMGKTDAEKSFLAGYEFAPIGTAGLKEVSNAAEAGFNAPKAGLSVLRSDELFGGMALVARMPKSALKGQEAVDAISGASIGIAKFDPKKAEPTKKDVPVLSTGDVGAIAKAVAAIAAEGRSYRNTVGKVAEAKKKLVAAAEKLSKASGSAEGDAVAGFKAMQKVAGQLARLADQPGASVSVYALNTCKALLDYSEQSLKQYK